MNNLYLIDGEDESLYVQASSIADAIERWRDHLQEDDPNSDLSETEPDSVQIVAVAEEMILSAPLALISLYAALDDLVYMLAEEGLVPESASYMQEARKALEEAEAAGVQRRVR